MKACSLTAKPIVTMLAARGINAKRGQLPDVSRTPVVAVKHGLTTIAILNVAKIKPEAASVTKARVKPNAAINAGKATTKLDAAANVAKARVKPNAAINVAKARVKPNAAANVAKARVKPNAAANVAKARVKPDAARERANEVLTDAMPDAEHAFFLI